MTFSEGDAVRISTETWPMDNTAKAVFDGQTAVVGKNTGGTGISGGALYWVILDPGHRWTCDSVMMDEEDLTLVDEPVKVTQPNGASIAVFTTNVTVGTETQKPLKKRVSKGRLLEIVEALFEQNFIEWDPTEDTYSIDGTDLELSLNAMETLDTIRDEYEWVDCD